MWPKSVLCAEVAVFQTLMSPSCLLCNPTQRKPPSSSIESTSPPISTADTNCNKNQLKNEKVKVRRKLALFY